MYWYITSGIGKKPKTTVLWQDFLAVLQLYISLPVRLRLRCKR